MGRKSRAKQGRAKWHTWCAIHTPGLGYFAGLLNDDISVVLAATPGFDEMSPEEKDAVMKARYAQIDAGKVAQWSNRITSPLATDVYLYHPQEVQRQAEALHALYPDLHLEVAEFRVGAPIAPGDSKRIGLAYFQCKDPIEPVRVRPVAR